MQTKNAKNRIVYITALNVVACLSVLFLHCNGIFWTFSKQRYWITANMIESFFYFAVPVFFMITGVTLMNYQERYSTGEFLKKRAIKTVIPFLFWSIMGLLFRIYVLNANHPELTISGIWTGIWNSSIVEYYWYFPSLFCVYLCLPLFAGVEKEKRHAIFSYLILAGFMVNSLIPFLISVFQLSIAWPISMNVCVGPLFYCLLGYLLHETEIRRKTEYIIYVCSAVGLLMHVLGTYSCSFTAGEIVSKYKGYYNVPAVMYATGIFIFFKQHGNQLMRTKLGAFFKALAPYTFSIYLLHWFIIRYVMLKVNVNLMSIWYRLGMPFVIVPCAVFLIWILRKIPVLRHMVPR